MEHMVKRLPDSELEVMLVIWRAERPLHTGEILQVLDPERNRRIQALQVVLGRLADKGFVTCEKIGRLNYYHAAVGEEDYRVRETESFLDRLYEHSPVQLVASLVKNHALSDEELAEIRRILGKDGD